MFTAGESHDDCWLGSSVGGPVSIRDVVGRSRLVLGEIKHGHMIWVILSVEISGS